MKSKGKQVVIAKRRHRPSDQHYGSLKRSMERVPAKKKPATVAAAKKKTRA
jgi:hypothetical protein